MGYAGSYVSSSASLAVRRRQTREVRPPRLAGLKPAAAPLPSCTSTLDVPIEDPAGPTYDHAREMAELSVANLARPTTAAGAFGDAIDDRGLAIAWGVLAAATTAVVFAAILFGPIGW